MTVAYVKMHQIKATLGKSLAYIARDDATRGGALVSSNAAVIDPSDARAVADQMEQTGREFGSRGSVKAHHVIQSFAPDEALSADAAHRLGVELAERIGANQHEYMVATHTDKGHLHNHIIVNAPSMETGRKLRVQRDTLDGIRRASDTLCRREGLRTLPPPRRGAAPRLADLYLSLKGRSQKDFVRAQIDKAASSARGWVDLENRLFEVGITAHRRSGSLSFQVEGAGRAVRDYRLGEAYTEAAIMSRLARETVQRLDVDRSLIIGGDDVSVRLRVPGSRGKLTMTLSRYQLVVHGRTIRAYVPQHGQHILGDSAGRYARQVDTAGLFDYFTRPRERPLAAGGSPADDIRRWSGALRDLHAIEQRVNASSRWESAEQATDAVDALLDRFKVQLVAATDLAGTAQSEPVMASLRQLERDITQARVDAKSLSREPTESGRGTLESRVKRRVAARHATRQSEDDQPKRNPKRGRGR